MAKPSFEQVEEFFRQVGAGRVTFQNLQRFLENPDVSEPTQSKSGQTKFTLTIEPGSLKQLIKAGGYDWVNDNITAENFPFDIKEKHEVEVELVHLDRGANTEEVLAELEKRGFKPALIEHLLVLGADHKELQDFPIAALGSLARDYDAGVPVLYGDDNDRYLDLDYCHDQWPDVFRFLAVRK